MTITKTYPKTKQLTYLSLPVELHTAITKSGMCLQFSKRKKKKIK